MPPAAAYVTNLGQAVLVALTTALSNFLGFLPGLIGALIVLLMGWIIAGLVARLIQRALQAVGFERAVDRAGIGGFIARTGTTWTTSKVVAELAKWFIFLIFVQAAANVLGMPQITAVVNSIVLFIPNVIVALVILIVGGLLANLVAGLVRGSASEMGLRNANTLATLTRYAIVGFAVIAAVDQLKIAATVVYALLIGLVGALALAFGLAFGLGGRDVAAEITRGWYAGTRNMADRAQLRTEQAAAGGSVRPVEYEPGSQQTQPGGNPPPTVPRQGPTI